MVKARRRNDALTVKLIVAGCVALLFLSPGLSRMLPAAATSKDSKAHLGGRSGMLEMKNVEAHDVMRGRVLDEVMRAQVDITGDYSTPSHNHFLEDGDPVSIAAAKTTSRYRTHSQQQQQQQQQQQFSRYTAQFGHRHLRGV